MVAVSCGEPCSKVQDVLYSMRNLYQRFGGTAQRVWGKQIRSHSAPLPDGPGACVAGRTAGCGKMAAPFRLPDGRHLLLLSADCRQPAEPDLRGARDRAVSRYA